LRIFGVILAGGAGRRMGGADKALIQFGGETLMENAIARLHPQVESLAISYNGASLATHFPILKDATPLGPLAGILAAMDWALGADAVVSVAVDTPHFPCDLVPRLHLAGGGGLAVARAERVHATFGLWPLSLRGALTEFLASGVNPKVMDFCAAHGAAFADFPDESAFANINTPQDLIALERG
jgi:molybdopterin-guanine dinucleotide biosynthesis protein A